VKPRGGIKNELAIGGGGENKGVAKGRAIDKIIKNSQSLSKKKRGLNSDCESFDRGEGGRKLYKNGRKNGEAGRRDNKVEGNAGLRGLARIQEGKVSFVWG